MWACQGPGESRLCMPYTLINIQQSWGTNDTLLVLQNVNGNNYIYAESQEQAFALRVASQWDSPSTVG